MKDKLLKLKEELNNVRHNYDGLTDINSIKSTLKMYYQTLFPDNFKDWEKRIDSIPFVSLSGSLMGFGSSYDEEAMRNGIKRLSSAIDDVIEKIEITKSINSTENTITYDTQSIFIVHGHDKGMRESVARFIEQAHLKPIILHEQSNQNMTIIEKLERCSNVGFAIVLLSPCDEGRAINSNEELKPRARQNVIAELGYFIGKLGRSHVAILKREEVDIPSDFLGVVYIPYDNNGGWKTAIAKELTAVGYDVPAKCLFA